MYSVKSGFGFSVVATRGSPFPVVLGSGFPLLGSPIGLVIVGDTTNLSPGAGPVLAAIGLGASPIECVFPFPVLFDEVSARVGLLWLSPVPTKLLVSTAGADGAPPALTALELLPLIQPWLLGLAKLPKPIGDVAIDGICAFAMPVLLNANNGAGALAPIGFGFAAKGAGAGGAGARGIGRAGIGGVGAGCAATGAG